MQVVADVVFKEGKPLIAQEMGNIFHPARQEVVHADDGMSTLDECIAEVAPQKSRPSGNHNAHIDSTIRSIVMRSTLPGLGPKSQSVLAIMLIRRTH
jgi:hypothetical protein